MSFFYENVMSYLYLHHSLYFRHPVALQAFLHSLHHRVIFPSQMASHLRDVVLDIDGSSRIHVRPRQPIKDLTFLQEPKGLARTWNQLLAPVINGIEGQRGRNPNPLRGTETVAGEHCHGNVEQWVGATRSLLRGHTVSCLVIRLGKNSKNVMSRNSPMVKVLLEEGPGRVLHLEQAGEWPKKNGVQTLIEMRSAVGAAFHRSREQKEAAEQNRGTKRKANVDMGDAGHGSSGTGRSAGATCSLFGSG